MNKVKVTFLVPDISAPIVGAATVMAGHLRGEFDVEIVGPDLGRGICQMYANSSAYRVVPAPKLYRWPDFLWQVARLSSAVTGDVVMAFKAYADTVPVAWWQKVCHRRKMVVYLDEWDAAAWYERPNRFRTALQNLHHPLDDSYFPAVERLIRRADLVISTTTFLQRKFGGAIVPFGVDTELFKPDNAGSERLRRDLGLQDLKLIVFGGVVRPHKGVATILEALALLANPRYRLLIVGPMTSHVEELLANPRFKPYLAAIGERPKEEMPPYLGMADLVVLPLGDNLLAQSQMPCKVFEAMAMAKPVIASEVSDLPAVLDGCGWTVPPGNIQALAEKIDYVFRNPAAGAAAGQAAREKCIARYSAEQTKKQLCALIGGLQS